MKKERDQLKKVVDEIELDSSIVQALKEEVATLKSGVDQLRQEKDLLKKLVDEQNTRECTKSQINASSQVEEPESDSPIIQTLREDNNILKTQIELLLKEKELAKVTETPQTVF